MQDPNRQLRAVWYAMIQRCENEDNPDYKYYGARGISVCKRWLKFENFIGDMGPRPKKFTLERKNNEKGYKPSNCHWATQTDQCLNRRIFKSNTTGVVGVTKKSNGRYLARFSYKGIRYLHTGSFATLIEASWARDALKVAVISDVDLTSLTTRGANCNSITGVKGISYSTQKCKFLVDITVDGKRKHLGEFSTLEEAKLELNNAIEN